MRRIPIEQCSREPLKYFWYPYIIFGMSAVFQGQAGYGKTTILSKIFAEASHGIYPPRLHKGTIKGRAVLTEWQKAAIEYFKARPYDEDISPVEIERKNINGMEVDGIDDEDFEIEKETALPMDRPFYRFRGEPIKMVYISRENHYGNIIRAKYEEFGGLPGYLTVIDESDRERFTTTEDKIREITGDAKLVVIDPIFPFIEGRLSDNVDVAEAMNNFDIVARDTGCAFLLINNLNKNGGSADIDHGMGASNLKNIARSLFMIGRDGNKVYIEGLKNNTAPFHGRIGILFDSLGRPDFIKYKQLEKVFGDVDKKSEKGKLGKETQRAVDLFFDYLPAGIELEHSVIKDMMKAANVSESTMNRAKPIAGVHHRTEAGKTVWFISE